MTQSRDETHVRQRVTRDRSKVPKGAPQRVVTISAFQRDAAVRLLGMCGQLAECLVSLCVVCVCVSLGARARVVGF